MNRLENYDSKDNETAPKSEDKPGKGDNHTHFRFAHLADCHLGAFREDFLRDLNLRAFQSAMDVCIQRKVDFIVISGDLFHRSFPDLGIIDSAVRKLREVIEENIRIYLIYGSHDYNANTTALIDVLNSAGLFKKVFVVECGSALGTVVDEATGVELAGLSGRTMALERDSYEGITINRKRDGFGIFLFHTAISELRPGYVPVEQSIPLNLLPEGFDYYAGGHIHEKLEDKGAKVFFPGPVFGADFRDLRNGKDKGFYMVDVENRSIDVEFFPLSVTDFELIDLDFSDKDSEEARGFLESNCSGSFHGATILLDLHGTLKSGSVADIDVNHARSMLIKNGAGFVVVNRSVTSAEKINIRSEGGSREDIESKMFTELFGDGVEAAKAFFSLLSLDFEETGMNRGDFEIEVMKRGFSFFGLEARR